MRVTVSSLAAFALFIVYAECGIQEKRIERINKDLKEDTVLSPINRQKKSATTTFCVEIRPTDPYQKPFQVCEPSYGQPPVYGPPGYYQPSYSPPSYESPSYPVKPAPYSPPKPSYVAPAPAYPSKAPSYNAPASKGYNSPHAAYSSYRAGDGDGTKHVDANDHSTHRATEESQNTKSGEIVKLENEEIERMRAAEEEGLSSAIEVDSSNMPRFSEDENDDELEEHSSMRTAYDGGYGIPPSYPGKKYKKGGHAGLVITCQPNLAGYAPAVPHYGGGYLSSYGHYRASARSYGYPRPYGYSAPSYKAPAYPPTYSPPAYPPPVYKPPSYPAPGYAPYKAPAYKPSYPVTYASPPYKAPVYPPPAYKAPAYGPPIYKPPSYGPPAYPQPVYKAPAYAPYKAPSAYPPAYPSPPAYGPAYKSPPLYSPPEYRPPPVYKPAVPAYKHPEPAYPPQPEYTPPPSYRESEPHVDKTEPLKMSDGDKEAHTIKKMTEIEKERTSSNWNSRLEDNKSKDDNVDDKLKARAKDEEDTLNSGNGSNLQGTWTGEAREKGGWGSNTARSDAEDDSSKITDNEPAQ